MNGKNIKILLVALTISLTYSGVVRGQGEDSNVSIEITSDTTPTRTVPSGKQLKIEGIVTERSADRFTLRGYDRAETIVVLSDRTKFRQVRKGLFRADVDGASSDIVRGLRLKAEGVGNSDGTLAASNIRFDEEDLRTAQALESRVDPVETQANSARALADANQKRLDVVEENAQRLSGQVDELSAVATAARSAAQNAQNSADQARSEANTANQRINSLDDYEVFKTVTVFFEPGSAELSAEAKANIDVAIIETQGANVKGWIVAVAGYADSTGGPERNRLLSERRADAVINCLVIGNDVPLQRVVRSLGYGESNPAAANDTKESRALNRRVEIRILVNKGIASQVTKSASNNN
jgi:outer membrane protein OmpA-like peptidoglycan-associated protein